MYAACNLLSSLVYLTEFVVSYNDNTSPFPQLRSAQSSKPIVEWDMVSFFPISQTCGFPTLLLAH